MDQSTYVRSSIISLQVAATLGAILAGVVVLVFLRSLRSTFVIVLAIPIAILATFIGMFYSGDTINSMTLGGLALAIGILVDQSIVVLDNITRHMRMGKSGFQAALDGTREVSLPVFVSTLTFIVVFFPVVFLTGIPRYLFTPLAVAVVFAVIASYTVAMFVIPSFCAKFLKVRASDTRSEATTGAPVPAWFDGWFGRLLSARWLVVAGSGGLLAVALFLLTQTGTELFPQVDSNQFTIYVRLPSGTRIERTEETIAEIEGALMDEMGQPDAEYPKVEKYADSNLRILISNIGVLMDWPAAYTPNTGPMDAFVLVQLKGKSGMPTTFDYVDRLRDKLNARFPGVEFAFDTGGMMTAALNFGLPSPINVRVQGSNLFTGEEIAMHVQRIASSVPGATDVRIAQRMDYPQIDIQVDRVKAAQLGVTQEDVVKNVVTTVNSSINFDPAFWIDENNGNHYFFGAQYAEEDIHSIETLKNVPITGKASVMPVALRNIADFGRKTGPAVVNHVNITRTIDVFANVERGYDVGRVAGEIEERLGASPILQSVRKETPRGVVYEVGGEYGGKGYSYSMSGEVETMRSSFKQFGQGLLIAVILVYLTMVAQLRSFGVPFVILLTIPLGFIGVGFVLWATRTNLSIPAFMGIIMMTGIVVEYSIILLDFANQRVEQGLSVREAVKEAAWIRLRPIMMTSLTTWLALIPMAIGFAGGEANAPLARTIIGGVLAATALTLVVVPCLYVMFKRENQPATAAVVAGV
jgi:multidrug efflux pump subunit AcrB